MSNDDVKMGEPVARRKSDRRKETRDEAEYRLFETMRTVCSYRTAGNTAHYIIVPMLVSMRTSGPDPAKHAILELSWMMIGAMKDLDDQPCESIKFEFNSRTQDCDAGHLKAFGLNLNDYTKGGTKDKLYSKVDGIGRLWQAFVIEGQKQVEAQRLLRPDIFRIGKPVFLFYNDDNAIRFFYDHVMRYREQPSCSYPKGGNLYQVFESGRVESTHYCSPYPLKHNEPEAVRFLPAEAKIRTIYNFNHDLEFPEPVGEIENEFDSAPEAYKKQIEELIEKGERQRRPSIRPIYSPRDEIHIMLVIYCTLAIPDSLWIDCFMDIFREQLSDARVLDLTEKINKERKYWTADPPGTPPFKIEEWRTLHDELIIKVDQKPYYKKQIRLIEDREYRSTIINGMFNKMATKIGLKPFSKHYRPVLDAFRKLDEVPDEELELHDERPYEDWVGMMTKAVEQTPGSEKGLNLDAIADMKDPPPIGTKPLMKWNLFEKVKFLAGNGRGSAALDFMRLS
jgi:hypothetical protein